MTVQRQMPTFTYEERLRAADVLQAHYSSPEAAERYFHTVLLPNILPESFPESDLPDVPWIGRHAKASIHLSKVALGDHFTQLITDGELSEQDAYLCANILDVPLELHDAIILSFRQ